MRFLKITGLLALFFCLINPLSQVLSQDDDAIGPRLTEYIVVGDSANLYLGAGTDFDVVGVVDKGDSLYVYTETPEVAGWLRVYQENSDDVYIAEVLVEKGPVRFYSLRQEPLFSLSASGEVSSDIVELSSGIYRIDAVVEDKAFILKANAIEEGCPNKNILNAVNPDQDPLRISTIMVIYVPQGCTYVFESVNVSGNWTIEIRDLTDINYIFDTNLMIQEGTQISSSNHNLTMSTVLPMGTWLVSADVEGHTFNLRSHVLLGECPYKFVLTEFDLGAENLEVSTLYENSGDDICVIYWEASNVQGEWTLTFTEQR